MLDAPDGGAISGLGCSLGYTRYRSGDRERWIKTAGINGALDAKWSERALGNDESIISIVYRKKPSGSPASPRDPTLHPSCVSRINRDPSSVADDRCPASGFSQHPSPRRPAGRNEERSELFGSLESAFYPASSGRRRKSPDREESKGSIAPPPISASIPGRGESLPILARYLR